MEPEDEDFLPLPTADNGEADRPQPRRPSRTTAGQKLAGQGSHVTLAGQRYDFVVDNRAVVTLEAKWGSMMALGRELEKGVEGKMFTAITDLLAACVRGLPAGTEVVDLMEFSEMENYSHAVLEAMEATGLYEQAQAGQRNQGNPSPPRDQPTTRRSTTKRSLNGGSRRKRSGR